MIKILFLVLTISGFAFGQSSNEEAIILNQELQFLENSAKEIRVERTMTDTEARQRSPEELSLESTYFNDAEKDEIRTRAAAPRRMRGL
ncbi:MAG: hypothetical protein V4598_08115 [Bdellovibrionota bacterium]